jgi:DNA-binding response OmpR family regulator
MTRENPSMSARILIVDDEPHIRTVMRLALESSGYEIGEASSGEEGLDRLAEGPKWDIVLLDERMPGIDGLETLRRLRRDDPNAIVIMVTAFASIELAVEAMKLGATDFVRKPMTPETLRAAVDGALVKARGEWPPAPAPSADASERRYEVWMLNGFRVRHVADGADATEQHFEVGRGQADTGRRIVVQFSRAVATAVEQEAGRSLAADRAFWIRQAAFALAHYVWNNADVPADGRLVVDRVSDDLLNAVRRAIS